MNLSDGFFQNNASLSNYILHNTDPGDMSSLDATSKEYRNLSFLFGKIPGSPYDPTFDHRFRTYQYPQAFKGKSVYLGQFILGLASSTDTDFILSSGHGLPVKRTDEQSFEWEVVKYDRGLMDIVPEEGPSRYLGMSSSFDSTTVQRRGIAFYIEHGFMNTPQGMNVFARSMLAIVQSIQMTWKFSALAALVNARCKVPDYHLAENGALRKKNWIELMEQKAVQFACAQKPGDSLFTAIMNSKSCLASRGHNATSLYLPAGGQVYFRGTGVELTTYREAGAEGVATSRKDPADTLSYQGIRLCIVENFQNYPPQGFPINPLRGQAAFGQMIRMFGDDPDTIDVANYKTIHRNTRVMDYAKDEHIQLSLEQCIDNSFVFDNPEDPGGDYPPGFHNGHFKNNNVDDSSLFKFARNASPISEEGNKSNDIFDLFGCRDSSVIDNSGKTQKSSYRFIDILGEMHRGFLPEKLLYLMTRKLLLVKGNNAVESLSKFHASMNESRNNDFVEGQIKKLIEKLFKNSKDAALFPVTFGSSFYPGSQGTRTMNDRLNTAVIGNGLRSATSDNDANNIITQGASFHLNDPVGLYKTYNARGGSEIQKHILNTNTLPFKGGSNMFTNMMYARMMAIYIPAESMNTNTVVSTGSKIVKDIHSKVEVVSTPTQIKTNSKKFLGHSYTHLNRNEIDDLRKSNRDYLGITSNEFQVYDKCLKSVDSTNHKIKIMKIVNGLWENDHMLKNEILDQLCKSLASGPNETKINEFHDEYANLRKLPLPSPMYEDVEHISTGAKLNRTVKLNPSNREVFKNDFSNVKQNNSNVSLRARCGIFTSDEINDLLSKNIMMIPLDKNYNITSKISDAMLSKKDPFHIMEINAFEKSKNKYNDFEIKLNKETSTMTGTSTGASLYSKSSTHSSLHEDFEFGSRSFFNEAGLTMIEAKLNESIIKNFPEIVYFSYLSTVDLQSASTRQSASNSLLQFVLSSPKMPMDEDFFRTTLRSLTSYMTSSKDVDNIKYSQSSDQSKQFYAENPTELVEVYKGLVDKELNENFVNKLNEPRGVIGNLENLKKLSNELKMLAKENNKYTSLGVFDFVINLDKGIHYLGYFESKVKSLEDRKFEWYNNSIFRNDFVHEITVYIDGDVIASIILHHLFYNGRVSINWNLEEIKNLLKLRQGEAAFADENNIYDIVFRYIFNSNSMTPSDKLKKVVLNTLAELRVVYNEENLNNNISAIELASILNICKNSEAISISANTNILSDRINKENISQISSEIDFIKKDLFNIINKYVNEDMVVTPPLKLSSRAVIAIEKLLFQAKCICWKLVTDINKLENAARRRVYINSEFGQSIIRLYTSISNFILNPVDNFILKTKADSIVYRNKDNDTTQYLANNAQVAVDGFDNLASRNYNYFSGLSYGALNLDLARCIQTEMIPERFYHDTYNRDVAAGYLLNRQPFATVIHPSELDYVTARNNFFRILNTSAAFRLPLPIESMGIALGTLTRVAFYYIQNAMDVGLFRFLGYYVRQNTYVEIYASNLTLKCIDLMYVWVNTNTPYDAANVLKNGERNGVVVNNNTISFQTLNRVLSSICFYVATANYARVLSNTGHALDLFHATVTTFLTGYTNNVFPAAAAARNPNAVILENVANSIEAATLANTAMLESFRNNYNQITTTPAFMYMYERYALDSEIKDVAVNNANIIIIDNATAGVAGLVLPAVDAQTTRYPVVEFDMFRNFGCLALNTAKINFSYKAGAIFHARELNDNIGTRILNVLNSADLAIVNAVPAAGAVAAAMFHNELANNIASTLYIEAIPALDAANMTLFKNEFINASVFKPLRYDIIANGLPNFSKTMENINFIDIDRDISAVYSKLSSSEIREISSLSYETKIQIVRQLNLTTLHINDEKIYLPTTGLLNFNVTLNELDVNICNNSTPVSAAYTTFLINCLKEISRKTATMNLIGNANDFDQYWPVLNCLINRVLSSIHSTFNVQNEEERVKTIENVIDDVILNCNIPLKSYLMQYTNNPQNILLYKSQFVGTSVYGDNNIANILFSNADYNNITSHMCIYNDYYNTNKYNPIASYYERENNNSYKLRSLYDIDHKTSLFLLCSMKLMKNILLKNKMVRNSLIKLNIPTHVFNFNVVRYEPYNAGITTYSSGNELLHNLFTKHGVQMCKIMHQNINRLGVTMNDLPIANVINRFTQNFTAQEIDYSSRIYSIISALPNMSLFTAVVFLKYFNLENFLNLEYPFLTQLNLNMQAFTLPFRDDAYHIANIDYLVGNNAATPLDVGGVAFVYNQPKYDEAVNIATTRINGYLSSLVIDNFCRDQEKIDKVDALLLEADPVRKYKNYSLLNEYLNYNNAAMQTRYNLFNTAVPVPPAAGGVAAAQAAMALGRREAELYNDAAAAVIANPENYTINAFVRGSYLRNIWDSLMQLDDKNRFEYIHDRSFRQVIGEIGQLFQNFSDRFIEAINLANLEEVKTTVNTVGFTYVRKLNSDARSISLIENVENILDALFETNYLKDQNYITIPVIRCGINPAQDVLYSDAGNLLVPANNAVPYNEDVFNLRVSYDNIRRNMTDKNFIDTFDLTMLNASQYKCQRNAFIRSDICKRGSSLYYILMDILQSYYEQYKNLKVYSYHEFDVLKTLSKKLNIELNSYLHENTQASYSVEAEFGIMLNKLISLVFKNGKESETLRNILKLYENYNMQYSLILSYIKKASGDLLNTLPLPFDTISGRDEFFDTHNNVCITNQNIQVNVFPVERINAMLGYNLQICNQTRYCFINHGTLAFNNVNRNPILNLDMPNTHVELNRTYNRLIFTGCAFTAYVPVRVNEYVWAMHLTNRTNIVSRIRQEYYSAVLQEHFLESNIAPNDYRYSNLEYFLKYAGDMSNSDESDVFISLLFCKPSSAFFKFLLHNNIPCPLGALIFRPFVVTEVCNPILGDFSNGGVGFFAVGKSDVMFQDDATLKSHSLHYTGYSTPVILDASRLVYLDALWMTAFYSGHNTKFFTRDDLIDLRNNQYRLNDVRDPEDRSDEPSLLSVLTVYNDVDLKSGVDIRGRFPDDNPLTTKRHFITTSAYYDVTGFKQGSKMVNPFSYEKAETNFFCLQTHQYVYNPSLDSLNLPILGKCFIGPNQYDGMVRSVFSSSANINRATLIDMQLYKLIASHNSAVPRY